MSFGKTTPILRIFDERKAKEFYVDYSRPRVDDMPYGTRDMFVHDPFGNRLIFTNAFYTDDLKK